MFRIPNEALIKAERKLVSLIENFRVVTYEQIHYYQVLGEAVDFGGMATTVKLMKRLAVKYHFSCFETDRIFARYRTDLEIPGITLSMWVYLDFLKLGLAGSVCATFIPYTPIVFEQKEENQLIELVVAPDDVSGIVQMNYELLLYDESLQEDGKEGRRRIVIVTSEQVLEAIRVKQIYLLCMVDNYGQVEYFLPESFR